MDQRKRFRPGCPRRGRRGIAAVALSVALAGCASILPQTPSAIFDLSAPGAAAEAGGGSVQILVPTPSALSALDTQRIAARPSPAEYAYLPNAVWADTLPNLLQVRLMETLQNTGRIRAAALPGQGLLINYQLVVDIRSFELTGEGAVAEFVVKLMDDSNGRVISSRIFREVAPVASAENAAVVAGLDAAMDAAFLDITDWALARI